MKNMPSSDPQHWSRILALLIFAHRPSGLLAGPTRSSKADDSKEAEVHAAKRVEDTGIAVRSPVQCDVRPMGLSLVGPVMSAGSDTRSAAFQKTLLLSLTEFLGPKPIEAKEVDDAAMLLDPSKLKLRTDSDVRVYFVGGGGGYKNTLGFNTRGAGVAKGDPKLVFPDASSAVSIDDPGSTVVRSDSSPLFPGDFVDLGRMSSGTALNFFLIVNGANGGMNVYSTDRSADPDGSNHLVSFAYAKAGSSLVIIGFQDLLGGGGRGLNDLVFAVDIGAQNGVQSMGGSSLDVSTVPELSAVRQSVEHQRSYECFAGDGHRHQAAIPDPRPPTPFTQRRGLSVWTPMRRRSLRGCPAPAAGSHLRPLRLSPPPRPPVRPRP